jgi:nucleoside-diphosphate-sugar epimerase
MANVLVTGAAGFIGSHLVERLVTDGHRVVGLDCFIDYYPREVKEANLSGLRQMSGFSFVEADMRTADLAPLLDEHGIDVVFHSAAMPGLLRAWTEFDGYMTCNLLATQRLLEAMRRVNVQHLIHASTSSVYGRDASGDETLPLRPVSPYGVTKLAAEHLCNLYRVNWGVPTVSLRYFTVYGPRQRPDMAFHKFIRAMLRNEPFPLYGGGEQTRDFTFIDDVVEANVRAVDAPPGSVFNISGGSRVTVNHVIATLEDLIGRPARLDRHGWQAGDVHHTWADASAARRVLGFVPRVALRDGLAAEVAWLREML